jgi:hypothetical protein
MKKINNKVLLIGLIVLVGIFVVARLFRAPKLESNARHELISLEVPKITSVKISTKDSVVTLEKENNQWSVSRGQEKSPADSAAVVRMLQSIQLIDATRMASRKKEKWAEFKVDSTSTRVEVYYDKDKEADFHIGKLGMNQMRSPQGGIDAYTYIRLNDEDEVYIVNGFLGATVSPSFNSWKKKVN